MRRVICTAAFSLLVAAASIGGSFQQVYATKSGKKYHTADCSSVKNSKTKRSMSLSAAKAKNLGPCKRCAPPK